VTVRDADLPHLGGLLPGLGLLVVDEDGAILLQTLVWRSGSA
jgi:hypothetical protein